MTKSYPSNRVVILDAPGEIPLPTAEFVYNFFLPDEYKNENPLGSTPNKLQNDLKTYTNTSQRQQLKRKIQRFVPRYNNLSWKAIAIGNRPDWIGTISITDNLNKVIDEETLSSDFFTSIMFKDNGADGKINYAISKAINTILTQLNVNTTNMSQMDMIRLLNSATSENIDGTFLTEAFMNLEKNGVKYTGNNTKENIVNSIIDELRNVKTKAFFNNKRIATLLKSSVQQPENIFGDETYASLGMARIVQENTIAARPNSVIDSVDYQLNLPNYISYNRNIPNGTYKINYQVIGYIIEKKEYPVDGQPITKDPIVIDNPNVSECVDYNVKYGAQYGYTVKSVFLLELPTYNITDNSIEFGTSKYMVASQRSPEVYIQCKEYMPPPPPADFQIIWDYQRDLPMLTWNIPVNSQRDVKYFQIFKRRGINEPYQLLKMYDFNDSQTPLTIADMSENFVDQNLVENLRFANGTALPKKYYYDEEFKREDTAIYAVACIDAHGYSSNYSVQFKITFDKFANKIITESISKEGAPKAYPNFFIQKDAFVDSIRTSGTKKMTVYFNPEYLKVTSKGSPPTDLQLLKTDINSKYVFQMINIDLETEQTIDIRLVDTRNETDKPGPNNISNNSTISVNNNIKPLSFDNVSYLGVPK